MAKTYKGALTTLSGNSPYTNPLYYTTTDYSLPSINDGIDYTDYAIYKSTYEIPKQVIVNGNLNLVSKIKGIYPQKEKRLVVVKFSDDSIIKLHCHEEDEFNVEIAAALAIAYKLYGTKGEFRRQVKKLTKGDK